ncbi:hypothetical protein DXG01_010421 [Tephrocybe rancida]|nr:hypothetical protein DXG01_010421 [Tephrocybe rancida]
MTNIFGDVTQLVGSCPAGNRRQLNKAVRKLKADLEALKSTFNPDPPGPLHMADTMLPFELVIVILSNLRDQTTDLRSCALVCDAWRTQSQAFLFHTVVLTSSNQCHQLHKLINESPPIGSLVKDIVFDVDIGRLDDPTLEAIDAMLRFSRLERLVLGALSRNGVKPGDLPALIREAVAFNLRQASLCSLELRTCSVGDDDLQTIFMHAPNLRRLSLSNVDYKPSDGKEALIDRINVEELVVVSEDVGILDWLCRPYCSVNVACLRSLTIIHDLKDGQCGPIDALLQKSGSSLESLFLKRVSGMSLLIPISEYTQTRGPDRHMKGGISLDLSHNSNLRSLRLNLAPNTRYILNRCPPQWVLSTLERIPSPVAIEELVLDIGIIESLSFKRTDYRQWRQMAAHLSSKKFPSLQCVRIITTDPVVYLPLVEDLATQAIQAVGVVWAFEVVQGGQSSSPKLLVKQ